MKAKVIYREAVLWDKPGGVRYKEILKQGQIIEVTEGWDYSTRTWKDKRFVKAIGKSHLGYINVNCITPLKENEYADNTSKEEPGVKESRRAEEYTYRPV